MKHAALSAY